MRRSVEMQRGALYWKAEAPNATLFLTASGTRGQWASYVAIAAARRKSAKQYLILINARSAAVEWMQQQIRRLHAHNNSAEAKGKQHVGHAAYTHLRPIIITNMHISQRGSNRRSGKGSR